MPSRFAFSLVVVTCLAWSSTDASLLDTVVPEETPGSGLSAKPNHLHPLALIATDAITTELVSMKKSAPSNAGVARIEEMIQDMNKESADPVSSHRCDAKSTADQASCSAKTTKAGCESVVDSDSKQKCKYQMDGGTKDMEDRLTTAKTAINSAVSTMLDGLTADYDNAKKDLKVMDDAIDNSKRTVSPTDFEAIKTKATTWCSKKRALETATSDAGTAASTLTEKLNAPLDLSDVKINEVGAIGPSTCSNTNGNAKDSTCPAASCNLASRIQSKIDTANGEYLAASWDKAEKDALKSTATTDESDSKGEFQAAVTTTASTYHTMCDSNDQLHDTAVNLFNNNNVGRASMYRSLGVIQCHINHMKSGQTLNVPTNLLKSGEAATSTSATNCVGKLKADSAIKTDLFPDASSTEDSSKTCPLLSAYEADIRNYGSLGFDKDDADWSATTTKCDAVTAHAATGVASTSSAPAIPTGTIEAGSDGSWIRTVHASNDGSFVIVSAPDKTPFMSTNAGGNWSAVTVPGDDGTSWGTGRFRDIEGSADGSKLVAIDGKNIYLSSNFGESWTKSSQTAPDSKTFAHVAVSSDATKIYITDGGKNVYWSHDGGVTFTAKEVDTRHGARSICTSDDGSVIALASWFWGGGVWVSTDSGSTFNNVDSNGVDVPDDELNDIACSGDGSSLMVAPTKNSGSPEARGCIFTSHDTGQTWSGPHCLDGSASEHNARPYGDNYDIRNIAFCSGSSQNAVAAPYYTANFKRNAGDSKGIDGRGPYTSSDGGQTWTVVPNPPDLNTDKVHTSQIKCVGDKIWMGTQKGIWFGSRV